MDETAYVLRSLFSLMLMFQSILNCIRSLSLFIIHYCFYTSFLFRLVSLHIHVVCSIHVMNLKLSTQNVNEFINETLT